MENFLNKLINPTVRTYGFKKKQFPASKTLRIRTKQQPYMLGIKRHYINKRRAQMLNENLFLRKTPARKESHDACAFRSYLHEPKNIFHFVARKWSRICPRVRLE